MDRRDWRSYRPRDGDIGLRRRESRGGGGHRNPSSERLPVVERTEKRRARFS